jgi:hypothetical protein
MFFFALCLFCLTNCGFDTSEAHDDYQVAKRFLETGQIGFDQRPLGVFTEAPNGRFYASHEFGNVLLLIPTAAANPVLEQLLTRSGIGPRSVQMTPQFLLAFQASLYAALTLAFLYLMSVEEFNLTGRGAFAGCVFLATCTYFWSYSRNLYDGVLCGLLLTMAMRFLLRYQRAGRTIDLVLAFACLGFGIATRVSMVIPAAAGLAFVAVFCTHGKPRGLTLAVLTLAPFVAWQLWYNDLRTGSPLVSPVQTEQYAETNALDGNLAIGLAGLLFSPGKGLFVYAPLLFLSVAVFPAFFRRYRSAAVFVLLVGAGWLMLHAKLRGWHVPWGWGPRHMVTILPVLAVPALVFAPTTWSSRWGRVAIVVMAGAGFVLAFASLVANWEHRMAVRYQSRTHTKELIAWSVTQGQAIDIVIGALNNLQVVMGTRSPVNIRGASDLNTYASNRINMWWYTLPRAGVPTSLVIMAAFVLLAGLVLTAVKLSRRIDLSGSAPTHGTTGPFIPISEARAPRRA